MDIMDYAKIGFRCGIEIHQQLETHKLFCSCPSLVNDTHPVDLKIIRKLRPSAGETGEIDKAALHEMKKGKYFVYEACSSSSCLVELDEEPPHKVNKQALDTALIVARLLNANIVDEIQFMRKTVVDGSNTSGFQRTALVATDGYIDTSLGKVGIPVLCLEEEAAKKIEQDDYSVTYRLDRLGVALLEIATDASIKTPDHAKEVASKLGMILRSTERVKRGLGTIRQDVNISIKGGARTEV
ncbi:MAG: Glu-tRNA(Gln) amidotransferase subunit GatE, partial [Nanoarchaeota archaeon]|nr:Glu-tRNA(Gln) amidotransferase subunit GatE [Nanoarchaeota archaeon]